MPDEKLQAEHRLSHLPYGSWCPSCVAGRARNGPHKSADDVKKSEQGIPVIQLDYGYGFTDPEGNTVQEVHANQNGTTVFAVDSSEVGWITALPILAKGGQSLKEATEEICRASMRLNAPNVILQCDPEPAMLQLCRSVQACRSKLGLQTTVRRAVKGDHQANGRVEKAISTTRRLAVTLKSALEEKLQMKITGSMAIFPWLIRHAAFLLNYFSVQSGSRRTSFEMLTDCRYGGVLAEFGETVFFYKPRAEKAEAKWQKAIWVGKNWVNDGHIVLTEQGGFESKVVRRIPDERRWSAGWSQDCVVCRGIILERG